MNAARYLHDNGDCRMGCRFCRWEDERGTAKREQVADDE